MSTDTSKAKAPRTLRCGTFNMLKDRPDRAARGSVRGVLADHDLHVLLLQETRDYLDVLRRVEGYQLMARATPRGADQNAILVRDDLPASHLRIGDLGGDGWITHDGHEHVGLKITGVTVDWCRLWSVHLPPSINWPHGKPEGPAERVDDYVNAMRKLEAMAKRASDRDGRLSEVQQGERYGSDHPLVTFKISRVGDAKALAFVGDYNCKPGRDRGVYTVEWLAERAGMQIGKANTSGHLAGIDLPLLKRR